MRSLWLLAAIAAALPQSSPSGGARPRLLRHLRGGAASDEGGRDPSLLESLSSLKDLLAALDDRVKQQNQAALPPSSPSSEPHTEPVIVDPAIGDLVRVRPGVHPKYEWGDVTAASIGRLVDFEGDRCVVDFPAHAGWHGLLTEVEKVADLSLRPPRVGDFVHVRDSVAEPVFGWGELVDALAAPSGGRDDNDDDAEEEEEEEEDVKGEKDVKGKERGEERKSHVASYRLNHTSVGEIVSIYIDRSLGSSASLRREVCDVCFPPDGNCRRLLLSEVQVYDPTEALAAAAGDDAAYSDGYGEGEDERRTSRKRGGAPAGSSSSSSSPSSGPAEGGTGRGDPLAKETPPSSSSFISSARRHPDFAAALAAAVARLQSLPTRAAGGGSGSFSGAHNSHEDRNPSENGRGGGVGGGLGGDGGGGGRGGLGGGRGFSRGGGESRLPDTPLRAPRLRMPGVPFGTWLGWTLGAATAQIGRASATATARKDDAARAINPHQNQRSQPSDGANSDGKNDVTSDEAGHRDDTRRSLFAPSSHIGSQQPQPPPALVRFSASVLSPLFLFATLLSLCLGAVSLLLDMPISALVDNAIEFLPTLLHVAQGMPGRAGRVQLTPLGKSMLLTPLRLPAMTLAFFSLYTICVPGYSLLVRARRGFEDGFHAASRTFPVSNSLSADRRAADGGAQQQQAERLDSILAVWSRLIWLVQAARLATVGIAGLALVERLVASHGAFAGPAGLSPMFEGSGAGGGGWDPPFAQGHSASSPSTPRAPLPAASPTADPILLGGGSR